MATFPLFAGLNHTGDVSLSFRDFEVRSGPKGMTTHFRVVCPIVANLVAYHNYIITYGASVTFKGVDGGTDRELEVEVPGLTSTTAGILSELFFDSWEMVTNESSDTIFANPLIIGGAYPVLNYNDKVVLSRLARDGGTMMQVVASCNSDIGNGLVAPTAGNGGTVAGLFQAPGISGYSNPASTQIQLEVLKGQTSYQNPTYVLRHTSYCSAGATYNANIIGTQKIYTPAQLLSEVGYGWTYNLPPRLYTKISSVPFQYAPAPEATYYQWGWLKKITREPVLANFMVEINCEYELGLWSNLRYAPR